MKLLVSMLLIITSVSFVRAMEHRNIEGIIIEKEFEDLQPCTCGCSVKGRTVREQNGIKKWHMLGISFLYKKGEYDCIASKERHSYAPYFFVRKEGIAEVEGIVSGKEAKKIWYSLKRDFNNKNNPGREK